MKNLLVALFGLSSLIAPSANAITGEECLKKLATEARYQIEGDPFHVYSEVKMTTKTIEDIRYNAADRASLRHVLIVTAKVSETQGPGKNLKPVFNVFMTEVDRNCENDLGTIFYPQ